MRWCTVPENKHLRRALYVLYAGFAVLALWLLLRYALPWLLPFLVAFAVARFIEPAVKFLSERYRISRGWISAALTIVIFAALITVTALGIARAIVELTALVKDLPALLASLTKTITLIGERIDGFIAAAPAEVQAYLRQALNSLAARTTTLPAELSGSILTFVSGAAKFTPKLVLFFFTTALSMFFISCGYRQVTSFVLRQVPARRHTSLRDFKTDLLSTFGKWAKAELMLAGITFCEMTVTFLFMRIEFAVLLALLVAVVDALPVVGSGAVLIPWALVSLIGGSYGTAVTLLIVYGVNIVVRSILEPRLVGRQIGLPPIATLMAMYIGFMAVGVLGMVLFPIGLIMVKHLNDKGYVKLWKN